MKQCVNAQFVNYVTYEIKNMDTCVAKSFLAFIHGLLFFAPMHTQTHSLSHTPLHSLCVCSGPGFSSDISEMVGTPASSVNEMGKALTPDGVIMSDGSLSHTDLMDMPVSKTA